MEELIFFAVIVFFSIIESIARSRKAKRSGQAPDDGLPELPLPPEIEPDWRSQPVPKRANLPSYDQDPSYDDAVDAGARGRSARPELPGGGHDGATRPSSETMLPGGLFEELAELAGQLERAKAKPIKLPKQSPPLPTRPRPTVPARRTPAPVEHRVHRAHAEYGTDPSERSRSEQDGLDPLAEHLSADARAVREQLASKNPAQLRRAFIMHEVFGPPVSQREDQI